MQELGLGSFSGSEDCKLFFVQDRNFLVMTAAGKPVFAMNGDIQQLAPLFATIYAIISKIESIDNSLTESVSFPSAFKANGFQVKILKKSLIYIALTKYNDSAQFLDL